MIHQETPSVLWEGFEHFQDRGKLSIWGSNMYLENLTALKQAAKAVPTKKDQYIMIANHYYVLYGT